MASSSTIICNMALSGIGAKRINDFSDNTESSPEVIQCRLHYEQTRNALLRSFWWRFAGARAVLSERDDVPAVEDFGWDYWWILPNDFMAMRYPYEGDTPGRPNNYSYELQGRYMLSNRDSAEIVYTKKVEDESDFDPLFIEVFVLTLQQKFAMGIAGDVKLKESVKADLKQVLPRVRAMDAQERNSVGRYDRNTWNNARRVWRR